MNHCLVRQIAFVVTVFMTVVASPAKLKAEADDRQALVHQLNTTLLDVMQSADTLGFQGRYEILDPALRASFDFTLMAKITVGRAWNEFDRTQRKEFVERFSRMSISTFASRFDGYSGERFEIRGEKPGPRDTVIVDDQIIRPDNPPVSLNFVLKKQSAATAPERWQIIDVMLDGKFSELARQRSEFSSILKNGGYSDLIDALDERIEALRENG